MRGRRRSVRWLLVGVAVAAPVVAVVPAQAQVLYGEIFLPGDIVRSAVGDLDGDGDLDQVAVGPGRILTWANDGRGGFTSAATYPGDAWPAVALADLDGDGDDDFLATVPARDVVVVRLASAGGLGAPASFSAGNAPDSLEVADLDEDGVPDLIVGGAESAEVRVLLGAGDGGFGTPSVFRGGRGGYASVGPRFAVGDVQGDGHLDVVAVDNPNRRILLLTGDGRGGLGTARTVLQGDGGYLRAVRLARMDADGVLDLVVGTDGVGRNGVATVSVARGDGTGRFAAPQVTTIYGPTNELQSLDVGRVDADDRTDVAVGLSGGGVILFNTGGGRLSDERSVGAYIDLPLVADLDGDGDGDVSGPGYSSEAAFVRGLFVEVNLGRFAYALPYSVGTTYPVGLDPQALVVGEMTGDRRPDVLVANAGSGNLALLRGEPGGTLSRPAFIAVGDDPGELVLADLDGDGDQDAVVLTRAASGQGFSAVFNNGQGGFRVLAGSLPVDPAYRLTAADVDDDPYADLMFTTSAGVVTTVRGDGAGGFAVTDRYDSGVGFFEVGVGDLDGDGVADQALADRGTVQLRFGDGTGRYGPVDAINLLDTADVFGMSVTDLDGDGALDLVTQTVVSAERAYFGDGEGAFRPAATRAFAANDRFADLNGDGMVDTYASDQLLVAVGLGNGQFTGYAGFAAGPRTEAVAVGDLDGDGRAELFAVDGVQNVVSVLRNLAGPRPADLVAVGAETDVPVVRPGAPVTVTDSVANLGNRTSVDTRTSYTLVEFRSDSGVPLSGGRPVPALPPGATSTAEVELTIPGDLPSGDYRVRSCVEAEDVYNVNQCSTTGVFTVTTDLPDLRSRVRASGSHPAGGTVELSDEASNRGEATALASSTRYLLSLDMTPDPGTDVLLEGQRMVPVLPAGATQSGTVDVGIPAATAPGTYHVFSCVDFANTVAESNEANNCTAGGPINVTGL